MEKTCKKCNQIKPIQDFYAHKWNTDGYLNFCRECVKERVRNHRKTEHGRAVASAWNKTPKGRAKQKRRNILVKEKYHEKYKCRQYCGNAIRDKRLIREDCMFCANEKSEAHHEDYTKPLEVMWLCRKCHQIWESRRCLSD